MYAMSISDIWVDYFCREKACGRVELEWCCYVVLQAIDGYTVSFTSLQSNLRKTYFEKHFGTCEQTKIIDESKSPD